MEGNYLKIVFVIDESGSMSGTESDVIGGFNGFIEKQILENSGKATVSVYKFDQTVKAFAQNLDIMEVERLDQRNYCPGGSTALLDAIGRGILETDEHTNSLTQDLPDKVIMVIITDGMENASRRYSVKDIRSMIETHEKQMNWEFVYLGADLNDFSDADKLGMQSASFDKRDMQHVFDVLNEESSHFRVKSNIDVKMKENIFKKIKKDEK